MDCCRQELTVAVTACMGPGQDQAKPNSNTDGGAHNVLPPAEDLLAVKGCWRTESIFFSDVA